MQSRTCRGLQARIDLQAVSDVLHQCLKTQSLAPLMVLDGVGCQQASRVVRQQHERWGKGRTLHTLVRG